MNFNKFQKENYKFLLKFIKEGNKINPVRDGGGLYTFCLGTFCLNCTMNAECSIRFDYNPPKLTQKNFNKMLKENPEYFI